ncbi:MAG: NAD-dependent epimerase/dehydratase family protein [bacterium]|nr:NAD-dependent epimerase/dehydratase family protein [bacterium]
MIFVTGGTGLLGGQLLYDLVSQGASVRALYRSKSRLATTKHLFRYRNPEKGTELFDTIEWVEGDILDIPSLMELMAGCSQVYHCAGLVSFHPKDHAVVFKINREGTANMVNVALELGVEKFCHVSSTAAIGGDSSEPITEATKWKNGEITSGYSLSKNAAEREVWRAQEEGLTVVIINPSVILGPGNWNETSLTIFQTVSKGLKFYPPGSNATVDVRDVSYSMIQLMESDIEGERYLCVGSNQSFKELMTVISKELDIKPPTRLAKYWQVWIARWVLKIVKGITGKRSAITKETVHNLFSHKKYDTSKLENAIGIQFYTLEEQVSDSVSGRFDK